MQRACPMTRRTTSLPQFSLGTIMLLVTLVAGCLAVFRISPFFGILGLLIAPPSLTRTAILGRARLQAGERFDHYDKLELFGESIAVSLLAYVAAIAAAFALWISIVSLVSLLIVFLPNNSNVEPVAPALFVFATFYCRDRHRCYVLLRALEADRSLHGSRSRRGSPWCQREH